MIFRYMKGILYVAVALASLGVITAGIVAIRDYADTKARLGAMETAINVQKATVEAQGKALEEWSQWRAESEAKLEELNNVSREARRYVAETRRDLSGLGIDRMDDATLEAVSNGLDDRSRCLLEQASGGDRDCPGED